MRDGIVEKLGLVLLVLASTAAAHAADERPAVTPPPPYSLPWLLRPAMPATVVRFDETLAFYRHPASDTDGATYLTSFTAAYKLGPRWTPVFRLTFARNDAPAGGPDPSGSGMSTPLLGVTYFHPFGSGWRWTGFLATTLPVGSGGGDDADPGAAAAISAAIPARSAMDNALFAVNYWTVIGGLGLARVTAGCTLQAEVTVLQLTRVRGAESQDGSRTNFTAGLHAGRFFSPRFSLGAELRMQAWLSDAAPVRSDPRAREQLTLGVGPRFHFKLRAGRFIRPGISYTRAFDDPMKAKGYDIVQIDVPFSF
jgi:hypothetical protein